tara:strand:- start:2613 stop:3809 length:1197 start_codon:yes stop_codon:yes gene_type:complete
MLDLSYRDLKGVNIHTFETGARYKNRKDLLLVVFDDYVNQASLYTKSTCPSVPVDWCRKNLNKQIKAIIVNAGNANAFTGDIGLRDLLTISKEIVNKIGCKIEDIGVASTGVIGEYMNIQPIIQSIKNIDLNNKSSWIDAAESIMTTDTYPKLAKKEFKIDGKNIEIIGIAKGSGMIEPNMGTMLSFIFTNACIDEKLLKPILREVTTNSFNSITVDGDTSTSDTVMLISTNKAGNKPLINIHETSSKEFIVELQKLTIDLAKQIVLDGEGATKLVEINIRSAVSKISAINIAKSIANSPLVKTAIYGQDPNWGRIIAAIGKSYENIDLKKLKISIGDQLVTLNSTVSPEYDEVLTKKYMEGDVIEIIIDLGIGNYSHKIWTCDLSHKYIDINTDYRS